MRLLVTRARDDAERTRARLEAAGHQAILSPLIETVGLDAAWPRGVHDAVVATSAKAFAFAPGGCALETRRLLPLLLVGTRTEAAARLAGFLGRVVVAQAASHLAEAIPGAALRLKRVLYLAGRDRKPDLEEAVARLGIDLTVVETYAAAARPTLSDQAAIAWRAGRIDGVLHFSRRSAALLVAASTSAGVAPGETPHFCLSDDVASELRDANCLDVRVAREPTEAGLLALLA